MRPKLIPAFTLIEVVVAMAIVAILAAVTIVSMSTYRIHAQLKRASHEFAAAIREAQNYALTGQVVTPLYIAPNGTHGTYEGTCGIGVVRFPSDSASKRALYSIVTIEKESPSKACNVDTGMLQGHVHVVSDRWLQDGVEFSFISTGNFTPANPRGVGFTYPRGEGAYLQTVNFSWVHSGFVSPVQFTVTKANVNYQICVYPSGRVEEVGTATSCP